MDYLTVLSPMTINYYYKYFCRKANISADSHNSKHLRNNNDCASILSLNIESHLSHAGFVGFN